MENTLYNPASLSKEVLINNFVVRTDIFKAIFNAVNSTSIAGDTKHFLVQGQRGMGKTTLLLRLKYEIENTAPFNENVIPVFFNEDFYDLTSLSNLWEKLLEYLDDYWNTGGALYEHTEEFLDDKNYEKLCYEFLIEEIAKRQKKLILLFDNFGQLFIDNLDENEKSRLNSILQTTDEFRIIAASAIVINELNDKPEPFYNVFKILPLEGLTKEETFELICSLQEQAEHKIDLQKSKAKIEALSILTGGVIRTLMMIYEVLLVDKDGTALQDLEMILDRITPLYKHRIEDLPVQQRKIVNVIAKQWDAIATKDLVAQIRENGKKMSGKIISAQLAQLEKNNVIEKKITNTKNHLYQLKERFFNIWYLMRNGDRKDKRRVKWLTVFLELWYDDEAGFEQFLTRHMELLKTGQYHPKSALLLSEALANSEKLNVITLDNFLNATAKILTKEQRKQLPNINNRKFDAAMELFKKKEHNQAIQVIKTFEREDFTAQIMLLANYLRLQQTDEVTSLLRKLEVPDEESEITTIIHTIANIAISYGLPKKALEFIEHKNIERDGHYYQLAGDAYRQQENYDKAAEHYSHSLELGHYNSFKRLIELYIKQENYQMIEKFVREANKYPVIGVNRILGLILLKQPEKPLVKIAQQIFANISENDINQDPYLMVYRSLLDTYDSEQNRIGVSTESFEQIEQAFDLFKDEDRETEEFKLTINILLFQHILVTKDKKMVMNILSKKPQEGDWVLDSLTAFSDIWSGKFERGIMLLKKALSRDLKKVLNEPSLIDVINNPFLLLIAKKQSIRLLEIFNEYEELQEILKPTYYALVSTLKKELPNEILKMGKELEEPVASVVEKVKKMKVDYK
ncbi:MAG: ATP-binding protein [Flavobacterium sp.]|nr:MAG: ATP-binding protein [Flavobacterium sp.]